MKADLTPISPAFQKDLHAFAFAAAILLLIGLPIVTTGTGFVAKRDRFLSMNEGLGAYEYIYKQIYEEKSDVDILFLGGSRISAGIDPKIVARKLRSGSIANAISFYHGLAGQDLDYFLVKELLQRRRVHMVVWQSPALSYEYPNWPNPSCVIWFGTDDEMLEGLSFGQKLSIYAQSVFTSLRDLLSLVRRNPLSYFETGGEGSLAAGCWRVGFFPQVSALPHPPFREFHPAAPDFPVSQLFRSSNPEAFEVVNKPLSPYHTHFLKRAAALLNQKHIPLLLIHMPLFDEQTVSQIPERMDWRHILGGYVDVLGIPEQRLFAGLSEKEKALLYGDPHHLNVNGSRFFTEAIFKGLCFYEQSNSSAK